MAVLPAGPRVYISGQAEPGPDLATATRKTLESLEATLKHLGLGKEHVVQVKAFFLPMKSADVVEQEVAAFFGAPEPPPLVLVEWRMSQPIEIELIAAAPKAGGEEAIEYLATPALKPSPVFSRVARVNRGDLVYVSGLFGAAGGTGTAQVETIFAELKGILSESGSDLRHMAKATYYVSDDDASKALNDLRPKYYDPARPPAASKATVPGVGLDGCSVTLDMIAVVPGRSGTRP
jgi:enamine deaminase RidA (YjgF/YER057c/UK114 family)